MQKPAIKLALDTISIGKQALVFANTKRSAEKLAEDLADEIKEKNDEWSQLADQIEKVLSHPTKQCKRLAYCVRKGVAFHHAGLNHKQKNLIEEAFREKKIRIITATPTLALGVSLPAFRVILNDLRRFGHRGLDWIPTLEYLQMAGRAGRPEWDDHGEAIAIATTEAAEKEIKERYIYGEPEDIFSKLAVEPVLRTYLLSLIATGFVNTKEQIIKFFSKTFWAHQYQDMKELEKIIMKMLDLLEGYEFIMSSGGEEFQSADRLGDIKYRATLLGKRVAELYIDPLTADHLIQCMKEAEKKKTNEFSLLQAICHTLEMRPLLRIKVKEYDNVQEELIQQTEMLLEQEPVAYDPEYEEFLMSVKTAMFLKEWVNEKDEEYLLEKYAIRPGEIRVKLDLADWLLYATGELVRILNLKDLLKEIMKIRIRIQKGAKEELLPLLKLKNIGRIRARKMHNEGIKDIGGVKKASLQKLTSILGKNVALDVKKQVGEKNLNNKQVELG